jgi:hypothetical protein
MPVFTVCVRVKGDLLSSFVFEDHAQADAWMNSEFLSLVNEYGEFTAERSALPGSALPGLRVGDRCNVWGEASDEFVVKELIEYSPNRWGFLLRGNCVVGMKVIEISTIEEVAKCHTEFLNDD